MKPFFSIILPCWNSIDYIERCITSIKKQTFKNFEVLIIDNSSKDGTLKKINQIKDKRFKVFSINNHGILAKSRNLGIKKSISDWIVFLDSDDWWTENKLQYCFDKINNNVDFIYHDLEIKSNKHSFLKRKKNISRKLKKPILIDLIINGNCINNSSVVVRKKFLEQIDGIDEDKNLLAAEDYNAWLRIANLTENFLYLPKILGYYFKNELGLSNKNMSYSSKRATSEFSLLLNEKQKIKLKAKIKYISGRYNYIHGNFRKSKIELLFSTKNGNIYVKIKSIIMIINIIFKLNFNLINNK